jgi:hypothetical protein
VFATKLAAERPVVVTMLVPHWMQTFDKASSEVKRCLSDMPSQKGEIRCVVSFVTTVAYLMRRVTLQSSRVWRTLDGP